MKNAPKYTRSYQYFKFRVIYFACPTSKINNNIFGVCYKFKPAVFMFSSKNDSKYPSLNIFLRPSWRFVKM